MHSSKLVCVKDVPIRDTEALDTAIEREHVGMMAIIEPESGGIYQHRPVVGVPTLEKFLHLLLRSKDKFVIQIFFLSISMNS